MYKVLIIEDDVTITSIVCERLEKWGYKSKSIDDFSEIIYEFNEFKPHLVLLDINLPYFDGFYWCNKIREISNIPIIFISSRDDESDQIRGISQGGDDYIKKPFSMDMLVAKIQAILRRTYSYSDQSLNTLEHRGLVLDVENNNMFHREISIRLTNNEAKILALFLRNTNKILPRYRLIKALWDDENFVDDNTLTVNINRLRKKLKELGFSDYIETIKGEGYRIG